MIGETDYHIAMPVPLEQHPVECRARRKVLRRPVRSQVANRMIAARKDIVKTDDFDFLLPPASIAAHPARPRDSARLLVVGPDGRADHSVRDLPALLRPGDLMVCNDTKVIPARLIGQRGAVRIEATLHKPLAGPDPVAGADTWLAFARPGKRLRLGDRIAFARDFEAEVLEKRAGGEVALRFDRTGADLLAALHRYGAMPLPPYIPRPEGAEAGDAEDYQTLFARQEGAVAAPTAGLHFTPELMAALAARGVETATVTLHVGAGTFLPVKTEDPRAHVMHTEYGEIPAATARRVAAAQRDGRRILAVGTTALRLLEGVAKLKGRVEPFAGEIDLFILPGFAFSVVDLLMTNFHLPRSTLFMLVCAFAGTNRMRDAYAHAVAAGYRFYSYGDACLLQRAEAETP